MEIGQHAIAVVLTVISSLRAITAGAPVLAVVAVSLVLLAWYGFGAVRAARSGSVDLARWWLF
ncbi:sensor histidine kinase, partial [Burkholderia multivorans]